MTLPREIKYRGRNINGGNWTYGDLIQLNGDQGKGRKFIVNNKFGACFDSEGNFINTESPFVNEVDPETVGQFTNLKDCNGVEIYEGDQLFAPGNLSDKLEYVGDVVWDEDDARWEVHSFHGTYEYVPDRECTVKGNIYESKEDAS